MNNILEPIEKLVELDEVNGTMGIISIYLNSGWIVDEPISC